MTNNQWLDSRTQPIERSSTPPADFYTSPDVFQEEVELIFARSWWYVASADDLRNPGDFVTIELWGEPMILTRGKDRKLRALSNVCRHRAAPVALGKGNRKAFQCTYHGWVYDLDGKGRRCIGMEHAEEFDAKDQQLPEFRVGEWEHWVFVTIDPKAPDFEEWIGSVPDRAKNYKVGELQKLGTRRWLTASNWKTFSDGCHEGYHVPFIHSALGQAVTNFDESKPPSAAKGENADKGQVAGKEGSGLDKTDWAWTEAKGHSLEGYFAEPNPRGAFSRIAGAIGGTTDFRAQKGPMEGLEGPERHGHFFNTMFPSFAIEFSPDGVVLMHIKPLGPDHTEIFKEWWVGKPANLSEKLFQAALLTFGNGITDEDEAAIELTQRGLHSRHYESGRISPTHEGFMHQAQQIWADALVSAREERLSS